MWGRYQLMHHSKEITHFGNNRRSSEKEEIFLPRYDHADEPIVY
jgi:hypothetical protein